MKKKVLRDIIIFILIAITISITILVKNLENYDELWNYNFAKNIAEGKLPYKDFNMIQMPLLPIICAFFLKIFANELIVIRILATLLNSAILFSTYKILELLKVNKYGIYIALVLFYFLYRDYLLCMDYNFAVLLICILLIYFELKFVDKNKNLLISNFKYDFILGIFVGTTILIKQTTGIFLSLIFIFYKMLIVSKDDWKTIFKIIFFRLVGVLIPVLGLFIYLSINNLWTDFLDYTFLGICTFDNVMPYSNLIKKGRMYIRILSIVLPLTIIYLYVRTIIKEQKRIEDKNLFILFAYSVANFIVIFPISDTAHLLIAGMPTIIAIIYIVYLKANKILKTNYKTKKFFKEFFKVFSVFIIIYLLITILNLGISQYNKLKDSSQLKHFKLIPSDLDDNIKYIDNYILEQNYKGKEVYILDASACIYTIPIDQYNKDYDMFLIGNLGSKGEKGQIEKLATEQNVIVLILNKKYSRNWQNPEDVRKYIVENWTKKGEIMQFDIYEKE